MAAPVDLATRGAASESRGPERIAAIIVAYFPRAEVLCDLLEAILPQVDTAVLVDNTPRPQMALDLEHFASSRCEVIVNGENLGLATAQNIGIARARELDCDHVLLLDQDSLPTADMVDRLLTALRDLQRDGVRVAAVGPRWHDRRAGRDAPFVRLGWGRLHRVYCHTEPCGPVECDTLVSSGSLIPVACLDAVGPMDPELFIDQVDTEWGLRAQARGFRLFGVCNAVLLHAIGEGAVRPFFAPDRRIPLHAPPRDYYLVRNTLVVFFRRRAPWRWRLVHALMLPALIVVMLTQMPQRRVRVRFILRAFFDAVRGRLGPLHRAG